MTLEELADRQAIQDVLVRYCHAVDQRDWTAFQALFAREAVLDYSAFGGPRCGAADMAVFLDNVLSGMRGYQHTISTSLVELGNQQATARTAAQVMMISADAEGNSHVLFTGLWYRDTLVKTAGGWQIRERVQEYGWVHNTPSVEPSR